MSSTKKYLTDEEYRAAATKDPLKVFDTLVDLRSQGIDPIDAGMVPGNPVTKKVKSADRWVRQQVDSAVAASSKWLEGVNNPSRSPVTAGIDADPKWKDKMEQAIREDRRKKGLMKTSDAEIITHANALGTGVYSSGVTAREDKVRRIVTELQPLAQSVSDTIQGMSDKTDADREKRLLSARKLMIEAGKRRRG